MTEILPVPHDIYISYISFLPFYRGQETLYIVEDTQW